MAIGGALDATIMSKLDGVRATMQRCNPRILRDALDAFRAPEMPEGPLPQELISVKVSSVHSATKMMRNGLAFTSMLDEIMRKKQSNRKEGSWRCRRDYCERSLEYDGTVKKVFENQKFVSRNGDIVLDAEVRRRLRRSVNSSPHSSTPMGTSRWLRLITRGAFPYRLTLAAFLVHTTNFIHLTRTVHHRDLSLSFVERQQRHTPSPWTDRNTRRPIWKDVQNETEIQVHPGRRHQRFSERFRLIRH